MNKSSPLDDGFTAIIFSLTTLPFMPGYLIFLANKKFRRLIQNNKPPIKKTCLIMILALILGLFFSFFILENKVVFLSLLLALEAPLTLLVLLSKKFDIDKLPILSSDTQINHKFKGQLSGSSDQAYIGQSLKTFKPLTLNNLDRCAHTLISGSTGSGKTTTLKSLFLDAVSKNHPILIIDPKGNKETIDEYKEIIQKFSSHQKRMRIFSIISPGGSLTYNPLKRGSAVQIKDRLMSSLEWSEQFYKNQAASFLGIICELLKVVGEEITLPKIYDLITDIRAIDALTEKITKLEDKDLSKKYLTQIKAAMKMVKSGNLDNLSSQLRDLCNEDFGHLLSPNPEKEIDLAEAIKNNDIIYFQLNTMAFELMAKAIGKLVLNDLKALASQIHAGSLDIKPKFFPIFIDEFGSFCSLSFIELLKMCRDVKFAMHLFFQSLADLDAVSPEFKSQVQQNCKTKIVLRTDDPLEVEFWSGVAGTMETQIFTHKTFSKFGVQIKGSEGSMRVGKINKVEYDAFKNLSIGQAILIQKAPSNIDLVSLWLPN